MKDEKTERPKSKRVEFEGVLLQPIEDVDPLVRALWTYGAKGDAKAAIDKEIAEFMSAQYAERVVALAERYGIDPRAMDPPAFVYTLLIRLAEEFVDGFKSAAGRDYRADQKGPVKMGITSFS